MLDKDLKWKCSWFCACVHTNATVSFYFLREKTHKQWSRTSQENIKAFKEIFECEEPELNRKEVLGYHGTELSFYFISYRLDNLGGERLNNVMVKVTGGIMIGVFEEKTELSKWSKGAAQDRIKRLWDFSWEIREKLKQFSNLWTSLIWTI